MLYSFRHRETGEVAEYEMSLSARETFINEHPELEQIIVKAPSYGDPAMLGVLKPPKDFLNKIDHIKRTVPGNNIQSKYWGHNVKEI